MRIISKDIKTPIFANTEYIIRDLPNGKKYFTMFDGEVWFHHYNIKKPQGIISDLKQCGEDLRLKERMEKYADFIKNSKVFQNEKIYGVTGFGGLTSVFDIGNGKVLKISEENPFEFRSYNPKFDIPLFGDVVHYGDLYGYVQQKAETDNMTVANVSKVKRRMKRAGFKPSKDFSNYRIDQVGTYNGKSYLLDSRCAIKRNNRKTRFADWFQKWFDRSPIQLISMEDIVDLPPTHIDETPKANYTMADVKTVIKNVLESWKNSKIYNERIIYKCLKKIRVI